MTKISKFWNTVDKFSKFKTHWSKFQNFKNSVTKFITDLVEFLKCDQIHSSLVKFLNHCGQTFKNLKYSVTKFVSVCYKKLRQCDQICIPVKAVWLNSCQFVMQIRKCDQICKQCDWIHISLLGKSGHTAFFSVGGWVGGVGGCVCEIWCDF